MKKVILSLVTLLMVLGIATTDVNAAGVVIGGNTSVRDLNNTEIDSIRNELVTKINQERKKKNLSTLSVNTKLEVTGNIRAEESDILWSHTRPNGKSWETVLAPNGISTTNLKAGEDLGKLTASANSNYSNKTQAYADTIYETWMNSQTHKDVILNSAYKEIGIGVYTKIENGKVTVYATGHFKNATSSQKSASTLKVSGIPSTKVYTGKQIKPTVTVKDGSKILKNGTDYTVTYGTNKNTGKATIKITGKGNYNGSITKTFYIVPKAPASVKLTGTSKSLKVSYKKATGATGYEISYSTKNNSGFKKITTTGASKTVSKLKAKTKYYIKIRAYKTVGGKKYYSSYTTVKSVKTK